MAAAAGVMAGSVVAAVIAYGIPLVFAPDFVLTNGAANATGVLTVMKNSAHVLAEITGLTAGFFTAPIVALRVFRALPLHSGPVRPVQ